jgi:hypothetical protein
LPETAKISDSRRSLYNSPKVIFAKMAATCEAFPDVLGDYASVNTNCFYGPKDGLSLQFYTAIFNSTTFTFLYNLYFGALRMAGGYFQWGSPQLRIIAVPRPSKIQHDHISHLVDWLVWLHSQPSVVHSTNQAPRDPLIAAFLDQWLNVLVCALYFPQRIQDAGINIFALTAKYMLPSIAESKVKERLGVIRSKFEELYDIEHPLRAAFYDFGSLKLQSIIENKG